MGVEPGSAECKAQTNPLSYGNAPFKANFVICFNVVGVASGNEVLLNILCKLSSSADLLKLDFAQQKLVTLDGSDLK